MKNLIRLIASSIAFCLLLTLTACGTASDVDTENPLPEDNAVTQPAPQDAQTAVTETPSDDTEPEITPEYKVLVVYFSATGTTKSVAEKIAAIENADLYEIVPAEPYSDADLNWHDSGSRTTKEQNDSSIRPEISSEKTDLTGYSKIYIGYPIWWGEEPRILDTFVESYDFTGKTVIPFCTSASSGIGRSGKNLADNAGSGNWLDGKRFGGGVSEDELRSWIGGMN